MGEKGREAGLNLQTGTTDSAAVSVDFVKPTVRILRRPFPYPDCGLRILRRPFPYPDCGLRILRRPFLHLKTTVATRFAQAGSTLRAEGCPM